MEPDYIFDMLIASGFRIVQGLYNSHLSDWMLRFRIKILIQFTISVIRKEKKPGHWGVWMIQWSCNIWMILLISLGFMILDYWPKSNQEILSLSFFWVWSSLASVGIFLVKSTHQIHTEFKNWTKHCVSTIHCLSQLQSTYAATITGFAATQICLCIQGFLRSKDRESSLNQ